jgi:hypothetical protein
MELVLLEDHIPFFKNIIAIVESKFASSKKKKEHVMDQLST